MTKFEPIEEPITEDGLKALVVESTPRADTRGRVVAPVHTWNGKVVYSNEVIPILTISPTKGLVGRDEYATAAAPCIEEPAQAIASALVRLEVKLKRFLAERSAGQGSSNAGGKGEHRQQQSLTAPGMVCVAEGEDGAHVYVVRAGDGTLTIQPSILGEYRGEEVEHIPPADLGWVLPHADAVLGHHAALLAAPDAGAWLGDLLRDLERWHRAASDLGREEAYLLLALYDLATYIVELIEYLAIILLEAEPERGKSRTGQATAAVMRHGVWLQGIREANLLRAAGDRQASLFIDVMDVWKKAEAAGCEDILLGRWEKGGTVERVLYPDKGPFEDTVSFPVFGPTVVATNEPIHRILDTRCLRIDMPLTTNRYSGRVQPERARPLIERLMAWRAYALVCALPAMDPPADGRLGDILRPLRQVLHVVAPGRGGEFDRIVAWQTKRRKDDLAQSTEAFVLRAIANGRATLSGGWLAIKTVRDAYNAGRPEDHHVKERWIGGKVRGMGWKVERVGHDNVTSLYWDDNLFATLAARYGLTQPARHDPPPDDPAPQEEGIPQHPGKDMSHVSHPSPPSDGGATHRDMSAADRDTLPPDVSQAPTSTASGGAAAATHATDATGVFGGTGDDSDFEEFTV